MNTNIGLNATNNGYSGTKLLVFISFLFVLIGGLPTLVGAQEFTSTDYKILDPVIAPGGYSTSDDYRLTGVITQIGIGTSTATDYKVNSGFLFFPDMKVFLGGFATSGQAMLYWNTTLNNLGWTVSGYNLGRSTTSGGPYAYSPTVTGATTTSTGLTNGTVYYFVVQAEDIFGNAIATSSELALLSGATYAYSSRYFDFASSSSSSYTDVLVNDSGNQLYFGIPANAVSSATQLKTLFYQRSEDDVVISKPLPSGKVAANTFYELSFLNPLASTSVTTLDSAATLTFTYTDSDISGVDESTLAPYRWDGSAWAIIAGSSLDTANNKITFNTQNFSSFSLMGTAPVQQQQQQQSSGGGGGGGGYIVPSTATVNFSGRAYPKSSVTLLKDAQVVASTIAGSDANFGATVSGLSGGNYIFSVYGEDHQGRRSSLLTFPVSVATGATVNVSGIFIAPTIAVDKSEVKRGDNIAILGQTTVLADVVIAVNSEQEFFVKTKSDKDGVYLYNFDTSELELGQHFAKSKAAAGNEISSFGKAVGFTVGTKNVAAAPVSKCPAKGDINSDCKVNLVDFSIAAYWWKRPLTASAKTTVDSKLFPDGKIDLRDFSIMAYFWTG